MDWNYHPEWSVFTEHYRQGKEILPKPKCFERMLEVASKLSEEFPILRVDLYEVNEKIYFGELTFFDGSGFDRIDPIEWDYEIGKWINLSEGDTGQMKV